MYWLFSKGLGSLTQHEEQPIIHWFVLVHTVVRGVYIS